MSSVSAAGGQSSKRIVARVLAVVGVLFAILGIIYLAVPASSLPGPIGHISGSSGHHALRLTSSFVVAVACLVAAWFVNRSGRSSAPSTQPESVDASSRT